MDAQLSPQDKRQIVLDIIDDAVSKCLYDDRKEDEELSVDDIHQLFRDGTISIDQATEWFRASLTEYLKGAP